MAYQSQTYTYTSQPQSLAATQRRSIPHSSLNNHENKRYIANIMYDKRVIRGATTKPVKPVDQIQPTRFKPRSTRQYEINTHLFDNTSGNNSTVDSKQPELSGTYKTDYNHIVTSTQTDSIYDELDDTIYTSQHGTQTEAYISIQAVAPQFGTRVIGIDCETQILPGELFNFDDAIRSILNVLCGKIISQSITEVQQETELYELRIQREQWEYQRNLLIGEAQRLEAITRRHWNEKELRKQAEIIRVQNEIKQSNQQVANTLAQQYINNLNDQIIQQMNQSDLLPDLLHQYIRNEYIPAIQTQIQSQLHEYTITQQLVDDLLYNTVQQINIQYQQHLLDQHNQQQQIEMLNHQLIQQSITAESDQQRMDRELQYKWCAEDAAEQAAIEQARIDELAEQERIRLENDGGEQNDSEVEES